MSSLTMNSHENPRRNGLCVLSSICSPLRSEAIGGAPSSTTDSGKVGQRVTREGRGILLLDVGVPHDD
jgi:hypothetical protein